jgi:hypothetical protein
MKCYALTRTDGGVEIMRVLDDNVSLAECLAKWTPQRQAQIVSSRELSAAEEASIASSDRTFRDAWRDSGGIIVHMPTAREIWRDRLRRLRAIVFAILDDLYNRALETGDVAEQARIAAKRQALRDVPADPRIITASTPAELLALPDLIEEAQNVEPPVLPTPEPKSVLLAPATIASFSSVPGASISYQNLTVPGLLATDVIVQAWFSADFAPGTVTYVAERVVSANTIRVRFQKTSTGAVTPTANQVLNVLVRR